MSNCFAFEPAVRNPEFEVWCGKRILFHRGWNAGDALDQYLQAEEECRDVTAQMRWGDRTVPLAFHDLLSRANREERPT